MEKTKTERIFIATFIYVWPYIITVSLIIFLLSGFNRALALNFFLGGAVSVMLMSHNYKTTMKTAVKESEKLRSRAIFNYLFRYGFYSLILAIIYFRYEETMYLIVTFLGFLSFKIVMILNFAISNMIYKKKGVDLDD
ncbi:MAG: ATP synthase subunit I [Candidatus Izemoplasmataceae bacterium]